MDIHLEDTNPTNPNLGSIPRPFPRFSTSTPPLEPLTTTGSRIAEDLYPEPTFQAADKAAALGENLARNPGIPIMPVPEEPGPIPTVRQAAGRGLAADEALPPPPPPHLRPNNPGRSSLKKTVSFQGETSHLTRPRREEDDRGEGEAGAEPGPRDIQ